MYVCVCQNGDRIHQLGDILTPHTVLCARSTYQTPTIPVCVAHQKFLQFRWKGQLWNYTCLPFVLADTPRAFTKVLTPVVKLLRGHRVILVVYQLAHYWIQSTGSNGCGRGSGCNTVFFFFFFFFRAQAHYVQFGLTQSQIISCVSASNIMSVHTCGLNKHKTQLFGARCESWMIQSAGWS